MSKLPQVKAKDLVKVVEKLGVGLLTKIIKKDLQISKKEFVRLLK